MIENGVFELRFSLFLTVKQLVVCEISDRGEEQPDGSYSAQYYSTMSAELEVTTSNRGGQKICLDGFMYTKKHVAKSVDEMVFRCVKRASLKCPGILKTTKSLGNPTVWKLIECLQADAATVDEILLQQERGIRPAKRVKRVYKELQTRIQNLVMELNEGKTIPEFLRGISYKLRGGNMNV